VQRRVLSLSLSLSLCRDSFLLFRTKPLYPGRYAKLQISGDGEDFPTRVARENFKPCLSVRYRCRASLAANFASGQPMDRHGAPSPASRLPSGATESCLRYPRVHNASLRLSGYLRVHLPSFKVKSSPFPWLAQCRQISTFYSPLTLPRTFALARFESSRLEIKKLSVFMETYPSR